jgi:hypothetical protein
VDKVRAAAKLNYMNRLGWLIVLVCLACSEAEPAAEPQAEPEAAPAAAPAVAGTFEYVYPHNTDNLIENHYIVLSADGGITRGHYHGTSDDFDSVREGYLPGFFVAEMKELRLSGDSIHFAVEVRPEDFFTKPVPVRYGGAQDLPAGEFEKWNGPAVSERVIYYGVVKPDQITLKTTLGDRVFNRIAGPQ